MLRKDFLKAFEGSDYLKFIEEKKQEQPVNRRTKGFELHHIYLRKFEEGTINSDDNLVLLTLSDHIKAHLKLVLSWESLKVPRDQDYYIAVAGVNLLFAIQWKKLTEEEKHRLLDQIPEIAELRKEAMTYIHERAQSVEAREKMKKTNLERYGHVAGRLVDPEIQKKACEASLKKRLSVYGNGMGKPLTEESKRKSQETRLKRYGDTMHACHKPEIQEKAHKASQASKLKKYGNGMGKANSPETRKKHKDIMDRKAFIIRTGEFLDWWTAEKKAQYKQRSFAVRDYLKEIGKNLEDFPRFNKDSSYL